MDAPPAAQSCWPILPSAGWPVMSATIPPSADSVPASPPDGDAVTMLRPSIIAIFERSGSNGALVAGDGRLVGGPAAVGRPRPPLPADRLRNPREPRGARAPGGAGLDVAQQGHQ